MALLRRYWGWLGHWLRLSQPGRALFTVVVLLGVAEILFVRAQGDREGGAPAVVLTLLLAGVVALDTASRGVVAGARRLVSSDGLNGQRKHRRRR